MTDDLMALYRTSAADTTRVLEGIRPDQYTAATPCTDWDVRALLNHLVGGNRYFIALATDAAPPSRDQPFIGDDPVADFRSSLADLTELFSADGFAGKPVKTPFGDGVGAALIGMRTTEMLLHGWDAAVATGQPRDFDPAVVANAETMLHSRPIPRAEGMFTAEKTAPAGVSAIDALAAFTGRQVPQD